MPVQILRIIQTHLKAMLIAGLCQLADYIAAKGSGIHNIILVHLGMEHGKTIVMFTGNNKVLHTAVLCQTDPFVRIKIYRIKGFSQHAVIGIRDRQIGLDPFSIAAAEFAAPFARQHRIQTPVRHHTVLRFFKPLFHIHDRKSVKLIKKPYQFHFYHF